MPENESLEISAKTVDEAINQGLTQLSLNRDQVSITIIKEGRRGVFGIGAENAVVQLTPHPPEPAPEPVSEEPMPPAEPIHSEASGTDSTVNAEPEIPTVETADDSSAAETDQPSDTDGADNHETKQYAQEYLEGLLDLMGIEANVSVRIGTDLADEDEEPPIVLDITGRDLGILIGRRNATLQSLQYVVRLAVNKHTGNRRPILIDVEAYRVRRRKSLQQLAKQMAEQAISTNRRVVLESMSAYERRIIHMTLRDNEAVRTKSVGVSENRKVTIIPT